MPHRGQIRPVVSEHSVPFSNPSDVDSSQPKREHRGVQWGVYAILDMDRYPSGSDLIFAHAQALLKGGARVLQLRSKTSDKRQVLQVARSLRSLTSDEGATFIVNDRADIAWLCDADGVHLGQDDLAPQRVRSWLKKPAIIGLSCHNLAQARAAFQLKSIDYIGFGPIFKTTSKTNPDPVVGTVALEEVCREAGTCPVIAIGGLTVEHLPKIHAAGASGAAMISSLLAAPDPHLATLEAVRAWSDKI